MSPAIYLLLTVSFTGIFYSLYKAIFRKKLETQKRLAQLNSLTPAENTKTTEGGENAPKTPLQKALELPIQQRMLAPLVSRVTATVAKRLPGKTMARLEKDVMTAGLSTRMGIREFFALYFVIFCGSVLLGLVLWVGTPITPLLPLAIVLGGLVGPRFWLSRRIDNRKSAIQRDLPEMMDLLTVSVEAGLGFESSLKKTAEEGSGPLAEEIKRVISEISMGKSRKEALEDLKQRVDLNDLSSFINAVIQSEQMGVGIARVLTIEAKEFRRKRRQRAEEQAMKAPIKMLIPLVFFIFPAIFVVLLGPAVLRIMDTVLSM